MDDPFPTTRVSLLRRLRDEYEGAWDEFFRIYGPLVHRIARCAGIQDAEADDVVASVMRCFVNAIRNGFEVDHERGRFRHYLKAILRREIANIFRRRGRALPGAPDNDAAENLPASEPPPDEFWCDAERQERLRACLDRLRAAPSVRPRDMAVFEAYALRGEDANEVSRRFAIPVDHVYTIKHRMMQRLRGIYHELEIEYGEV